MGAFLSAVGASEVSPVRKLWDGTQEICRAPAGRHTSIFEMAKPAEISPKLKVEVIEAYNNYEPPFDVTKTIIRMLESIPPQYLVGLGSVVLTNKAALSSKRLTSTTKSRKRKVRIADTRGLYHGGRGTESAWIELFVDSIYRKWTKGLWLKISLTQDVLLGNTLFHEIGHHIHYTKRPEFREREDVADDWSLKLGVRYILKYHALVGYFVRSFWWLLKPLSRCATKRLNAKYAARARKN